MIYFIHINEKEGKYYVIVCSKVILLKGRPFMLFNMNNIKNKSYQVNIKK